MGSRIKILPAHVANKIAAGEVVERPASVAKELIENAVDGGATQIDLEITAGGRKLVAVRDNGHGMNRDDALLAIEQHATSKIREVDDIEHISSLGFRGEALAAIASVSRFRLTTCVADENTGTEVSVSGGKLYDVKDVGCPTGTTIEVRDLFFNIPARRKFLRSHQTELSHLRACFIVQALAHPEIGMSFTVDGRQVHVLPGRGAGEEAGDKALEDRVRDLFGPDYLHNLRSVHHHTTEVDVSGLVSLPAASRADRNEIYIFVNGRATSAPLIGYAVREGYRTLLPADRYPSVFLFITLDSGLVDVNVHPAKREVRFRHPSEVRDALIAAIRQSLGAPRHDGGGQDSDRPEFGLEGAKPRATAEAELKIENLPLPHAFRYPRMPEPHNGDRGPLNSGGRKGPDAAGASPEQSAVDAPDASPWSWCRVLGQIGSLYVVMETEDGYVLMDPHAAHERVLFERFMAEVIKGEVRTQNLLLPETVELSPKDALRVRQNVELLTVMGFGISEFGGDAFVVDAMPSYFADTGARELLIEVSTSLDTAGSRGGAGRWREESIAQAACKSAVKARDRLTLQEIEQLVIDLAQTEMPYTCPHGRPTLIFTSFHELNRKFGRE